MTLLTGSLRAAPLPWKPEPAPLLSPPDSVVYFEARPQSCSQDEGCLIQLPEPHLPEVLAAPLRAHLPAAAARILLPAEARWMLAARNGRGPLAAPAALVPRAPRAGEPPRVDSLPFDLVARADRLHVAAMFLIGVALMLGSAALGLVVRHPAEPVFPGAEEPFVPESKILPRLVASPVAPPARTRP